MHPHSLIRDICLWLPNVQIYATAEKNETTFWLGAELVGAKLVFLLLNDSGTSRPLTNSAPDKLGP